MVWGFSWEFYELVSLSDVMGIRRRIATSLGTPGSSHRHRGELLVCQAVRRHRQEGQKWLEGLKNSGVSGWGWNFGYFISKDGNFIYFMDTQKEI